LAENKNECHLESADICVMRVGMRIIGRRMHNNSAYHDACVRYFKS